MRTGSARVAIVGAGSVGATIAYATLIRGVAEEVVLFDVNRPKVDAEVLDLRHGLQFVAAATVDGSDDVEICRGADVVVVTAGAKQQPGQTRMELAAANAALCRDLLPRLVEVAPDAIVLLVTNPVDVITEVAVEVTGLPVGHVFGSGTVLDTSRLRHLVAQRCDVAVQSVHAFIAGEHGDTEIALWSSATIGSVPLLAWTGAGGPLTEAEEEALLDQVRRAAYRIIEGKGATNYAIGLATARILEAVLRDERAVLPVSVPLDGHLGLHDVCLSLPAAVGRGGVEHVLPVPLSERERRDLEASAEAIRSTVRSLTSTS